jgi:hypothetical protein
MNFRSLDQRQDNGQSSRSRDHSSGVEVNPLEHFSSFLSSAHFILMKSDSFVDDLVRAEAR